MDVGAINQMIGGIAARNLDVALLARLLQEQRVAGAAMVGLIAGATSAGGRGGSAPAAAPADAPPPPPKGADEPGKGGLVDVVA